MFGSIVQNNTVDLNYRTEARIFSLDFDSLFSDSSTNEPSEDLSLDLEYRRLLANRWLAGGIVSFERNDEHGLDLRTSVGVGGGRILRQSDNSSLSLIGGLLVSREDVGIEFKWEIIEDLFWALAIADSYDSKAELTGGENNDYSVITSVGWDF